MNDPSPHESQPPRAADSAAWWNALRRFAGRVIDTMEAAAQDPALLDDLSILLGGRAIRSRADSPITPAESAAAAMPVAPKTTAPSGDRLVHETRMETVPLAAKTDRRAEPIPSSPDEASPVQDPGFTPARAPAATVSIGLSPRVVSPPEVRYPAQWTQTPFEPAEVAHACRMKASACRWQHQRALRLAEGIDVAEDDHALVDHARLSGVWLWMMSPAKWRARGDEAFFTVAGCYDALADAAELMKRADELQAGQADAISLLSEAQSALRVALETHTTGVRDQDPEKTFTWLRHETEVRQVWIEFMQRDKPARPENHSDLTQRIAAAREPLDQREQQSHKVERGLAKLKYHADRLARNNGADADEIDIAAVCNTVDALVNQAHLPVSDLRLRERLRGVFGRFSSLQPHAQPTLQRVLKLIADEIDQQAMNDAADLVDGAADTDAPVLDDDPTLCAARARVGGLSAVLIGGRPIEVRRAALESGLKLRSLTWTLIEHHESFDSIAGSIRRPGVGLVLLMTRWRSHSHGPATRQLCKSLGIPVVELPAGYGLRQVAHQILAQMPASSDAPAGSLA